MRTPVHDDVALVALTLALVVENRDGPGSLHNSPVAAAERCSELWDIAREASLTEASVLGTVIAIDSVGEVGRRHVVASRRHRPEFPPCAAGQSQPARLSGRQESKRELSLDGSLLLELRCRGRNPSIRRIDDLRRAPAR